MQVRLTDILAPSFYATHLAISNGLVTEAVEKGGRASLKSSGLSVEVVNELIKHPDIHAAVFRRYSNTLRRSVYDQITWAIDKLGLTAQFRFTVSPMEIVYKPTGQKIMFFGLDDPGKIKSIKVAKGYIGICWFEELDQFDSPDQITNVEQSLFRGGPYSLSLKSFNPPASARNWVNKYVLVPKPGQRVHHSTYLQAPAEWLGPRFLADAEHIRRTNPVKYRHDYLGEIVGSGSTIFENLQLRRITDAEIANFDRITAGVDWGYWPDPWAYNRMHYDAARRTLYIFFEATRVRTGNQDTAAIVLKHSPRGEYVIADSAEPKSCADYRALGIRCRDAKKGPGSVEYSSKWLQDLDAIVIDPARCPDTAREFSEHEYARDKLGNIMPGYPDYANHHIDAVRYGTSLIWRHAGQ